jgi:two-component system sensor histidine kinase KdpD
MLAALTAILVVLLPFRAHLSIAIPALAFILPAVVGVTVGGFTAGAAGALAGFVAYDYFFLPPYNTLTVRSPQNWIALTVYVAVVLIVARVVANLRSAREEALRRNDESTRLHELSQALIGDITLAQLLSHIVTAVQSAFAPRWTALVLPDDQRDEVLRVAATAGEPLDDTDTALLTRGGGRTRSLGLGGGEVPRRVALALVVSNRPVGMLVLQDVRLAETERRLLGTFGNQAALAVDRARLRDAALRARLLEEIDRWRSALMGAASHDLRTPLASIKTAVSSLRRVEVPLTPDDRAELLELIELQTDRLSRLVSNLLDMTRIEAGALELRPAPTAFGELVAEASASLGGTLASARLRVDVAVDLPLLRIDHVLVSQVLVNLLENAERLSPTDAPITVRARVAPGNANMAEISVTDEGPGITGEDRERVFEMFSQNGGGGRAGLGLAIAKAFVQVHGGTIWIDPEMRSGTRVVFTVPCEVLAPAPTGVRP